MFGIVVVSGCVRIIYACMPPFDPISHVVEVPYGVDMFMPVLHGLVESYLIIKSNDRRPLAGETATQIFTISSIKVGQWLGSYTDSTQCLYKVLLSRAKRVILDYYGQI